MATDTDSNPYTVPTATAPNSVDPNSRLVDFAPILRRWERLRIYYNAILVTLVLSLTFIRFPGFVSDTGFWTFVTVGGAVANFFYFLGPAFEAYGTHFRCWTSVMTMLLFLAGLGLTAFLAVVSVMNF